MSLPRAKNVIVAATEIYMEYKMQNNSVISCSHTDRTQKIELESDGIRWISYFCMTCREEFDRIKVVSNAA